MEGFKFRRQQPVGSYVVDFVNLEKKVVIELDGAPGNDPRVIQALKLATDRQAVFDLVVQGDGSIGRDSPIGPLYSQYYSEETPLPERDVEAARQLLVDAGYGDGLNIELHTPDTGNRPNLAAVLKSQWEEAGVNVDVKVEPESVYYGDNGWLEVDLGITGWGSRPYPQFYLDTMLVCNAVWNESHFCDAEFDQLAQTAGSTMDEAERIQGSCTFGEPACRRVLGCCDRLAKARTRGELDLLIAREMQAYSVFELQVISGRIHHEIDRLPSPYREAVRPYFLQQVFEPHHQALLLYRSAGSPFPDGPLEDLPLFREYLAMVPSGCFSRDLKSEYVPHLTNPAHTLFYYLVGAFTMFVLCLPGHPEGMPFPGGFRVEKKDGKYYCPVRDKEKEVPGCLCNFCPALQSPEL